MYLVDYQTDNDNISTFSSAYYWIMNQFNYLGEAMFSEYDRYGVYQSKQSITVNE